MHPCRSSPYLYVNSYVNSDNAACSSALILEVTRCSGKFFTTVYRVISQKILCLIQYCFIPHKCMYCFSGQVFLEWRKKNPFWKLSVSGWVQVVSRQSVCCWRADGVTWPARPKTGGGCAVLLDWPWVNTMLPSKETYRGCHASTLIQCIQWQLHQMNKTSREEMSWYQSRSLRQIYNNFLKTWNLSNRKLDWMYTDTSANEWPC